MSTRRMYRDKTDPLSINIEVCNASYSQALFHNYNFNFFSDLCGAVSDPLTICRTVVVGKSASLVCRLLYLLSYFIRCSEIEEQGIFKNIMETQFKLDEPEESDIFPDSRAGSSLTLLSESGRSSGQVTSGSLERVEKVPLVKPHPFGIGGRGSSISRTSSYSGSLNQSSMTLSCGSLNELSNTGTPLQQPRPILGGTQRAKPSEASNVCQSVPVGMLGGSDYRHHSVKDKTILTPFIPHTTHSTGIVTNLQRRGGGETGRIISPLLSRFKISEEGGRGGERKCDDHNCQSTSSLYSACPVNTNRVIWQPGRGGGRTSSPTLSNEWQTRSYDLHTKTGTSFSKSPEKYQESPGNKLLSESSTDSLSTGYHTTNISRNPSGTSIGASTTATVGAQCHMPLRLKSRQGTCSSFDSGVFEHTSILTTDSERLAEFDSLQMSNGSSFRGRAYPPQGTDSLSSLVTAGYGGNESTGRRRSDAFSFGCSNHQSTNGIQLGRGISCPLGNTCSINQQGTGQNSNDVSSLGMGVTVDDHVFSQSYDGQQKSPSLVRTNIDLSSCSEITADPVNAALSPTQGQSLTSSGLKCASSPTLSSMDVPPVIVETRHSGGGGGGCGMIRNSSYKGLPVIEVPGLQNQLSPSPNHLHVSNNEKMH